MGWPSYDLNMTQAKARTGFYSGSFDPVTLGHADVIARALQLVDRLVIGIGVHPGKTPMFTIDERIAMLQREVRPLLAAGGTVEVVTFAGLTVDAAGDAGASVIFRGLRDATDFDYEMQMCGMNGAMAPAIGTVFLPASPGVRHITATLVRQIAQMGGDVSKFVSAEVASELAAKARR
jgi:pantetheine-phosphate adenylyltransferase